MGILRACSGAAVIAYALIGSLIPPVVAQGTGSITGTVTTQAAALKPLRVTIDQKICGNELPDESIVTGAAGELANAVVTLVGVKSRTATPSSGIMNEKCRFSPRVQIARPNAPITTSSRDPILHTTNAQGDGGRALFNVAVPVPGITINKAVKGAGVVRLSCNTHPWMRGWVIVTDEAAAITAPDGRFTLSDVPAGTYELRMWHETLKGASQRVVVSAGQMTTINFEMK
jgi:plastocyanin